MIYVQSQCVSLTPLVTRMMFFETVTVLKMCGDDWWYVKSQRTGDTGLVPVPFCSDPGESNWSPQAVPLSRKGSLSHMSDHDMTDATQRRPSATVILAGLEHIANVHSNSCENVEMAVASSAIDQAATQLADKLKDRDARMQGMLKKKSLTSAETAQIRAMMRSLKASEEASASSLKAMTDVVESTTELDEETVGASSFDIMYLTEASSWAPARCVIRESVFSLYEGDCVARSTFLNNSCSVKIRASSSTDLLSDNAFFEFEILSSSDSRQPPLLIAAVASDQERKNIIQNISFAIQSAGEKRISAPVTLGIQNAKESASKMARRLSGRMSQGFKRIGSFRKKKLSAAATTKPPPLPPKPRKLRARK